MCVSRLVQEIRGADGGSSTGVLNKVWDFSVEDQEAEFRDDLREASGVGRRRKGKVRPIFEVPFVAYKCRYCLASTPIRPYPISTSEGPHW